MIKYITNNNKTYYVRKYVVLKLNKTIFHVILHYLFYFAMLICLINSNAHNNTNI